MRNIHSLLAFVIALVMTGFNANAKNLDPETMRLGTCTQPALDNQSFVVDFQDYPFGGVYDRQVKNYITFAVDYNCLNYYGADDTYTVDLLVDGYTDNTMSSQVYTQNISLTVSYSAGITNVNDQDIASFDGAYFVMVTVVNIIGNSTTQLPGNMYIQGEIHVERFVDFVPVANYQIPGNDIEVTALNIDCSNEPARDYLHVNWTDIIQAEDYDIEWTYVNDYSGDLLLNNGNPDPNDYITNLAELKVHFERNATRATTVKTEFDIPLIFDHGYVLFRVRPVGRKISDPSVPIFGKWSWNFNMTNSSQNTVDYFINQNQPYYFVDVAHEGDLNWQSQTTFAEDGKRKDVLTYFDGTLRNRQTVTRLNTTGVAVVGESIYDYHGRAAIQVLPAPVTNDACANDLISTIHFYRNFNLNGDGNPYSSKDFDLDNLEDRCEPSTPSMSAQSGASNYYSGQNPELGFENAFIPDAQKFPFSQVEFTPDNTGRIRRQSGVGSQFQLSTGHETKYLYGTPHQLQLDRLFGSEAGYAKHYKKNAVMDPNGQVSISYLDMSDRVVATALVGQAPTNLIPLDELPDPVQLSSTLFSDAGPDQGNGDANELFDGSIVYDQVLLVPVTSEYVFDYSLEATPLTDECLANFCMHCVYDLDITITNDCGELIFPTQGNEVPPVVGYFQTSKEEIIFTTSCEGGNPYLLEPIVTFNLLLEPGEYTIHKELSVNQDARDFFIEQYMTDPANICVLDSTTFVNEALNDVDITECSIEFECQDCIEQLGDREYFIATGPYSAAVNALQYDWKYEECLQLCAPLSGCKAGYTMMLLDVGRNGQYGEYEVQGGQIDPSTYSLSVFNENNLLPENTDGDPVLAWWRHPRALLNGVEHLRYINDDGTPSMIFVDHPLPGINVPEVDNVANIFQFDGLDYVFPEHLANVEDFLTVYWQDSWVYSLVTFHPEWCYYESCREYSLFQHPDDYLTSDQFDDVLMQCTTWQDAIDKRVLRDVGGTVNEDEPLYWFDGTHIGDLPYSSDTDDAFDPFVLRGDDLGEVFTNGTDLYGVDLVDAFNIYAVQGAYEMSMSDLAVFSAIAYHLPGDPLIATPDLCGDAFWADPYLFNTEVRDFTWFMLRNTYLGKKREIQSIRENMYAIWECGGYNGCFDEAVPVLDLGTQFALSSVQNPGLYADQPCNPITAYLYSEKLPRFASTEQAMQSMPDAPPSDQCPGELYFQNLLNAILGMGGLNQSDLQLSTVPEYAYVFASTEVYGVSALPIDLSWNATVNGNTIQIDLVYPNQTIFCSIILDAGQPIDWNEISYISNLSGPANDLSMTLFYNGTGQNGPEVIDINGNSAWSCPIDLGGCNTPSSTTDCYPNVLASNMVALFNALITNNEFGQSNVLLAPTYQTYLTDVLMAQFPTATYADMHIEFWPNGIRISNISNGNEEIVMLFDTLTVSGPWEWVHADYIHSLDCGYEYLDPVSGLIVRTFALHAIVSGQDHIYVGNASAQTLIRTLFCNCITTKPSCCTGPGYDEFFHVQSFIAELINETNVDPEMSPPFSPTSFSPLLANYIPSQGPFTQTLEDCIYYGGVNAECLTFTGNGCDLSITMFPVTPDGDPNTFVMATLNTVNANSMTVEGEPDEFGNYYSFKFTSGPYTFVGTWCVPMKTCDEFPPCAPIIPMPEISYTPEEPCADQLENIAYQNGMDAYWQWYNDFVANLAAQYDEHCLTSVIENMHVTFDDQEYQYTLYYYDQAGNLVRTVPPAGIKPLDITGDTQLLAQHIAEDRVTGDRRIFTFHSLTTTYNYNSLNQLVAQNIPDHDLMDVWDISKPTGIDNEMSGNEIQYVTAANAYMGGERPNAMTQSRGLLYNSFDAGYTWSRVNNLVAANLRKIEMLNSSYGLALGEDGVLLKTIDNGGNWDMLVTYDKFGNLIAPHFNDMAMNQVTAPGSSIQATTYCLLVGENGLIMRMANMNTSNQSFNRYTTLNISYELLPINIPTVYSQWNYKSVEFVQSVNGGAHRFVIWADIPVGSETISMPLSVTSASLIAGSTLSNVVVENAIRASDFTAVHQYANLSAVAGTKDGKLYRCAQMSYEEDGTTYRNKWYQVHTTSNLGYRKMWFYDAKFGVAILDEVNAGGTDDGLYATKDGGETWEKLSPQGVDVYDIFPYHRNPQCSGNTVFTGMRLLAVGNGGVVARVTIVTDGEGGFAFDPITENGSSLGTTNLRSCWAAVIKPCTNGGDFVVRMVIGGADGKLFTTMINGYDSQTSWEQIPSSIPGVFIDDIELHTSESTNGELFQHINGVLLLSDGTVRTFFGAGTAPDCTPGSGPDETCNPNEYFCFDYCPAHFQVGNINPIADRYFTHLAKARASSRIFAVCEPWGGNPNTVYDIFRFDGAETGPDIDPVDMNFSGLDENANINSVSAELLDAMNISDRIIMVGANGANFNFKVMYSGSGVGQLADDRYDMIPLSNNDLDYAHVSSTYNNRTVAVNDASTIMVRRAISVTDTDGPFKVWNTMHSAFALDNYTAVDMGSATAGLIGTNKGDLHKFDLNLSSGPYTQQGGTTEKVPFITSNSHVYDLESEDSRINGIACQSFSAINCAWAVGDNGLILRSGSFTAPNFSAQVLGNVNYKAVSLKLGIGENNNVVIAGDNARIENGFANGHVINTNVFVPGIKDMHFINSVEGVVVANGYTIRHTTDGGQSWSIIRPNVAFTGAGMANTMPTVNNVVMKEPGYAYMTGNNSNGAYIQEIMSSSHTSNTVQTFSGSNWRLNEIQFDTEGSVIIVGKNGSSNGVLVKRFQDAGPWQAINDATALGKEYLAFHVFPSNNTLIACGTGSTVNVFDGTIWMGGGYGPTGINTTFFDVFFHDDLVGYLVGAPGAIYKTQNGQGILPEYDQTTALLSTLGPQSWVSLALTDAVANQPLNASKYIYSIDFSTRWQGVWCGKYSGTPSGYHRLIIDESQLFSTKFYYDRLGRIVASQNTKQFENTPNKQYSYSVYDALGRIVEAGQKDENTSGLKFKDIFGLYVEGYYNPRVISDSDLNTWLGNMAGNRTQVTHTYYDVETTFASLPTDFDQNNLRKRVSSVTYEELRDGNANTYEHGTHYTYDIHGNVSTLLQDFPEVGGFSSDQRHKRMDYVYDLISGNVEQVSYQAGRVDQWYHRYLYDADNRITDVYTAYRGWDDGTDVYLNTDMPQALPIWEHEAEYFYYLHGPLARVELGDLDVQGLDYAYTLQGWLKGVNAGTLDPSRDIGQDGLNMFSAGDMARDVFGFTLSYFSGDYQPIDYAGKWSNNTDRFEALMEGTDLEGMRSDLWNGNIGAMVTALPMQNPGDIKSQAMAYQYDQLNRIKYARALRNLDEPSNKWGSGSVYADEYYNAFEYDENGNIWRQWRSNEAGVQFDNLKYRYHVQADTDGWNRLKRNRLYHVIDGGISGAMTDDIESQGTFTSDPMTINSANNYSYDQLGQLIRDNKVGGVPGEGEEIELISWRVDGKISEVKRYSTSTKKSLRFVYDAMGNRVAKKVYSDNTFSTTSLETVTYYSRDAQGNVMAVYSNPGGGSSPALVLSEQHMYGSSRLGMRQVNIDMLVTANPHANDLLEVVRGEKYYELSNHLGNVLVTISDQKFAVNAGVNVAYYQSEVMSFTDYYPFGSVMNERTWDVGSGYRYGFQGQERENEINNEISSFEYRLCNSSLGRFFSIDPILKEYPSIGSYTFCENRVIDGIDWEGLEWKDAEGKELSSSQLREVKVYIFYVEDFKNQAMDEYKDAVALYGKDKVALSNPGTVENFENDWKNMEGTPDLVVVDMHGKNQSLMVSDSDAPTEQITSTGDGKTNISGTAAKNVQDLPTPKANLLRCELQLNTCHSNDTETSAHGDQGEIKGSGKTLAKAFQDRFHFNSTRCTAGAVNYRWPGGSDSREPYPENGKWEFLKSFIDSPIKPNKNETPKETPIDRT